MAHVYKRLLSDFYLPEPPAEEPIPRDFRRLPGEVALRYSPALRLQIRMGQTRRAIARDLVEELGERPPTWTLRTSPDADPEQVGGEVRRHLKVEFDEQKTWRDARAGYRAWRSRIEAAGVLVFQAVGVDTSEMLGFSLAHEFLPVVAVNRKSKPNQRIFTLIHELAHVMIGASSTCDLDEESPRQQAEQRVETFCNRAAGAALVPAPELLAEPIVSQRGPGAHAWDDDQLEALARVFCVSEEVLLRRLLTLGRTTPQFYQAKRKDFLARYKGIVQLDRAELEEGKMRRNMPREAISNFGRTYTRVVLDSLAQDHITLVEASRFLNVRPGQLRKIEQMMMAE